jgi:glycosidase
MSRRTVALALVLSLLGPLVGVGAGSSPASAAATSVTIAGSLQDELGCPGDWQPECPLTQLGYDAEDGVWQGSLALPAGTWEYKAALDGSWTENYGIGAVRDGPNIALPLAAATSVRFYYDDETHWVTDDQTSVIATAPGSYQSELGCAADWDPGCLRSWLQDADGDGTARLSTSDLPPGSYEFKIALDESWEENYGAGGLRDGPNIAFSVASVGDVVTLSYDQVSHVAEVSVVPTEPVDDAALVREPVRHPFVDEVLYFAIPDRFDDGNPANNCGDYAGTCRTDGTQEEVLTHGYLPDQKGYYHGGDLAGLRRRLPYLDGLGITAIWVGPIFTNQTVQSDTTDLYGHSAGYHGYWIRDFLRVDPHLGTNQEFGQLVDEAHRRGIRVFMDVVTNHTADIIQLEGNAGYRNTQDFPYTDVNGEPFDDRDFAYSGQSDYTFPTVDLTSFPYTPLLPPGAEQAKNPAWLNDPLLYHNRGNTSFTGENSLYGDFFGLDDLWTERREVVEGMVDIYSWWIEEFGVDGFRIDTTKHANLEFWQRFGPAILDAATARGIEHFFAFGEVFDQQFGPPFMSHFSTEGQLQSTIDFGFQLAAREFASQGGATDALRDFFALDDWYTDADSNAYAMPTFLGNHDMGRIGHFLQRVDQQGSSDAELLARSQLAHALMFFARGQPVVYYGDEQGFTGDGGDKDAREDMFANEVPVYADNDLIGTDETTSDDNFDAPHPLYQAIRDDARLYQQHTALRTGAQIHRYSSDGPGIYAFSRIDRDERIEYVVAFNNSEAPASAGIQTYSPAGARYRLVSGGQAGSHGAAMLTTGPAGELAVTVPALGFVIYEAKDPVPRSDAAPAIDITSREHGETVALQTNSWDGHEIADRIEVAAELDADVLAEVTFAVREGNGDYVPIGTDDNAPYRVFYDASHLRGAEPASLSFRAIVNDLSGHLASDEVVDVGVEFPEPEAPTTPYALIHYERPAGDYGDHTTGNAADFWGLHLWGDAIAPSAVTDWTSPMPFLGEDEYGRFAFVELARDDQPVNFIVHRGDVKDPDDSPDRSFDPFTTPEIWLRQGDATIYTSQAAAQGATTVHFACTDCSAVTLDATSGGQPVETGSPPDAVDDYGAVFTVTPADLAAPLTVTLRVSGQASVDGQSFTPTETPSAWFQPGEQVTYPSRGAAEDFAVIHYRRPAGDYGDPSSTDFADFWGLHVWTGAVSQPVWTDPLRPTGTDVFGIEFRVDLVDGADQLAYILHRGDSKDPGPDQFLVFDVYGHEVWQLQGADPAQPYVAPLRR